MAYFIKSFISTIFIFSHLVQCHYIFDLSSSSWRIYNRNRILTTIGSVPGGVYSALENVCKISDILFGKNDINYRWIGNDDWVYYREFELNTSDLNFPNIQLVLHGVDTIANVYLNSKYVLGSNNMFVRYTADIKSYLLEGRNNITVLFKSPIQAADKLASESSYIVPPLCHPPDYHGECSINMLRKMQASFAWDWGPAFPSVGLWKPVEIVMSEGPVISSVKVYTSLDESNWKLDVTVGFDPSNIKYQDTLMVELSHKSYGILLTSGKKVNLNKDLKEVTINLQISESKIKKWWPNGYGDQTLYNLRAYYTHSEKTVQIGFRTIELIQENVSNDESNGKTFYFVVNGVKMFAKGSNWIPSHVLPEKLSDSERIIPLLEAGAESHFNMLRVWGGGVYESDLFYETCDRLGILVWQDFMFACSMYPSTDEFLDSVKIEVKQQIDRLQHHPSIAIWAGNNENEGAIVGNWYGTSKNFSLYKSDYVKLYVDTIMPIVKMLDPSRVYVTSSPSNGVQTEKEGYVSKNPGSSLYGDVHYYNYLADGWDYRIYPNPRFASEYGVQSLPSSTCLRAAMPLGEMRWVSDNLQHRQHSPGGNAVLDMQIKTNLPPSNNIYDIVYLSQIHQAMTMKTESEKYRRLKSVLLDSGEGYTMGALYWQLNDIWQAPSWSSIDYCGHWKMLQYYAKEFFAPIIVSPELSADGTKISIYIVVDGTPDTKKADLTLNIYNWSSADWNPVKVYTNNQTKLEENKSFIAYQVTVADALSGSGRKEDFFLTTTLEVANKPIAPENFLFFTYVRYSGYPETSVKISGITLVDNQTAEITLVADRFALFVWLDLNELKGTFSKNGFHMLKPTTKVTFRSKFPVDLRALQKITVTWLKKSYS